MIVEILEMSDQHRDRWAFEEWRCQRGGECCSIEPAVLGHWLIVDYDNNDRGFTGTPFIAVFEDGAVLMVCEDCAVELEEERRDAEIALHEQRDMEAM